MTKGPASTPARESAVVIGASMAGILAARVLADHFDHVHLIDRDHVRDVSGPRRGVPHAVHAHGLHGRGHHIIADLFPGFTHDAKAAGMGTRDVGQMEWHFSGHQIAPVQTGWTSVVGPRAVLENLLRQKVLALPNVTLHDQTAARGFVHATDADRLCGVSVRGSDGVEDELAADLVVDAAGRGSVSPTWLKELGYCPVGDEQISSRLTYTTARFQCHEGTYGPPKAINPTPFPGQPRGAFFGSTPNGQVLLSLTGIEGERPGTRREDFVAYARALNNEEITHTLDHADWLSEPTSFTIPTSRWRHYEQVGDLPAGFVAVGDAVATFNPVYGQGMTVAAEQALTLDAHLRAHADPDPYVLADAIARTVGEAWAISTSGDLAFKGIGSPYPPSRRTVTAARNLFHRHLHRAMAVDPEIARAYLRTIVLLAPGRSLFSPRIVARLLHHLPGELGILNTHDLTAAADRVMYSLSAPRRRNRPAHTLKRWAPTSQRSRDRPAADESSAPHKVRTSHADS